MTDTLPVQGDRVSWRIVYPDERHFGTVYHQIKIDGAVWGYRILDDDGTYRIVENRHITKEVQ